MEAEPNECKNCFSVIENGQEYRECTNPENLNKNPHKLCKTCYEELLKGYDYEDELLDPRTLAPTPKQNADGTEMLDARGRPILMNNEELIEFYKMEKHVKHDEGCPWKDGKLVKKTMGQPEQPITLRVTEQPSRPSGPGAGVRRQGQGAAAAAHEPQDVAFRNAMLASTRETETPIQEIRRRLRESGIDVPEKAVRNEFQTLSRQSSSTETDEAIRQIINMFKWPRQERVMNRVRDELPMISDDDLRISVRNMLEHEPNEERAANSVVQLFTQTPRGGKKSKMSKSRKGKKSKMTKSRKGKKSKMTKSRRGKKSKMTRKKV